MKPQSLAKTVDSLNKGIAAIRARQGDPINFFQARQVEMSDGSELHEVITPDGLRVASAESPTIMSELAEKLNADLKWFESFDVVINA